MLTIRRFFLFLGLRILRPKFLHFRKKLKIKILFLTFFIFSDVKKTAKFKKKKKILKKNKKKKKNLHCKNAEFLHFYSVKSYNFCYFVFSDSNMLQINKKKNLIIFFLIIFPPPTLIF